ncbi:MAG: L-histidine N(alpha)-methyltransferase [Proteobacteria bacterium]|nr:L-histidine N(alpha)-methyltransferase [Pseudomonadota bacterium]
MSPHAENITEIVAGLTRPQKSISSKYFYDERGSQLFDAITQLPEYYLTGTEIGIMRNNIAEIVELVGKQASLIEFGSGSSLKTRILLEHLDELAAYVPVDISEEHLLASAQRIGSEFPDTEVLPVVADFTRKFDLPTPRVMPLRNIVYFPGSTIGNFEHSVALDLLRVMRHEARENGALLIGVDLQKDAAIIDNAYNDSQGITAEFNLNILRHLNQVYAADFDLDEFSHDAQYDAAEGRVVIHLVSARDQVVYIGETRTDIAHGEKILTEYSHKYTLQGFAEMAGQADFRVEKVWADAEDLFSVQYLLAI